MDRIEAEDSMQEYYQIRIDETEQWNRDFLERNKIKRIQTVLVYNLDRVHCCELTASYEMSVIRYEAEFTEDIPEEERDRIEEEIQVNLINEEIRYIHCSRQDKWAEDVQRLERQDAYQSLGDFESLEDAIEEASCNYV